MDTDYYLSGIIVEEVLFYQISAMTSHRADALECDVTFIQQFYKLHLSVDSNEQQQILICLFI